MKDEASKLKQCSFTSVWDSGSEITTPATYDPKTGEIFPEYSNADPDGCLEREFITLDDEEIEVCPDCHGFTMRVVIGDRADLSYGDIDECRNPDCESKL
jgi:hypothetical protein